MVLSNVDTIAVNLPSVDFCILSLIWRFCGGNIFVTLGAIQTLLLAWQLVFC